METVPKAPLSPSRVPLLALLCGLLIANLYYVQPIADLVAADLRLPRQLSGLLTTLPLIGYGIGLIAVVPLGDLLENRRLIVVMMAMEAAALFALAALGQPLAFLLAGFVAGLSASAIQVVLPYASLLLPQAVQGRAVARLVSGVMLGIMLARPGSSFIAEVLPWRAVYLIAGLVMALLIPVMLFALPAREPAGAQSYGELMGSMATILRRTEILRRRALYHAAMFGAFISFWTAVPLWLVGAPFNLSQSGLAWVTLAGVAGAIAPPFAGRLVDLGYSRAATLAAMIVAMAAFALTLLASGGSVAIIVAAAIILDAAVSANLVFGQRAIYALAPETRVRMNALYIAIFFSGGAVASAVSAWSFVHFGWTGVVVLGVLLPLAALLYGLTETPDCKLPKSATVA